MGPVAYAVVLTIALLISAQLTMLLNHPGPGASIGLGVALAAWLTAVVLAHRNPPGPGNHTADS